MGRVLTAPVAVKAMIESGRGEIQFEETFWGFIVSALNAKAPVGSLEQICEAKDVRKLVKAALEEKSATITVEDAQYKLIQNAAKAHASGLPPAIAMEIDSFLYALEDKTETNKGGADKIDLATKK